MDRSGCSVFGTLRPASLGLLLERYVAPARRFVVLALPQFVDEQRTLKSQTTQNG